MIRTSKQEESKKQKTNKETLQQNKTPNKQTNKQTNKTRQHRQTFMNTIFVIISYNIMLLSVNLSDVKILAGFHSFDFRSVMHFHGSVPHI